MSVEQKLALELINLIEELNTRGLIKRSYFERLRDAARSVMRQALLRKDVK